MSEQSRPQPCKECPFRKESAAGWIGGHECPEEITRLILSDQRFPCHMEVTKLVEHDGVKFDRAIWIANPCKGAAAMLSNMLKLSRQPEMARTQSEVRKRGDVFSRPEEMHDHHNAFLKRRVVGK